VNLKFVRRAASLAISCVAVASISSSAFSAPEQARSADSFVDSMGICTHLRYTWTAYNVSGPGLTNPYVNSEFWLKALGIRHLRDGFFEPNVNDEDRRLFDLYGIRSILLVEPQVAKDGQSRPWDIPMMMDDIIHHATPAAIEAIEGPNETDNDKNFVYPLPPSVGHAFPEGTKDEVARIYTALKSDPATRNIGVIAGSTGRQGSQAREAPFDQFDFEVMHSYNWDRTDPMSAHLGLQSWIADANSIVGAGNPTKPIYCTETSYQSVAPGIYSVDEQTQAKYLPRIYAEYFRAGIVRTCIYELIDDNGDKYGLVSEHGNDGKGHWNLAPKPSFFAVKNLISVLGDAKWNTSTHRWDRKSFSPGKLNYSLGSAVPTSVHHLLLQKSSGEFYLLLWNETESFDPKTNKDIEIRPIPLTLSLLTPIKSSMVWTQTRSGGSTLSPLALAGKAGRQTIKLNISDSVMILRLRPNKYSKPQL
jgi:hypothetical protein